MIYDHFTAKLYGEAPLLVNIWFYLRVPLAKCPCVTGDDG